MVSKVRSIDMASQIDPMVPTVKALILLDDEGKRIAVQYFAEEW